MWSLRIVSTCGIEYLWRGLEGNPFGGHNGVSRTNGGRPNELLNLTCSLLTKNT